MKIIRFSFIILALGLFACGGEKKAAADGDKKATTGGEKKGAKAASGDTDYCAALLKKGTEVCNADDVKKYGPKYVVNCLKPYQEQAKSGDQAKCKMMTPQGK